MPNDQERELTKVIISMMLTKEQLKWLDEKIEYTGHSKAGIIRGLIIEKMEAEKLQTTEA